jgi:hypothetical protein
MKRRNRLWVLAALCLLVCGAATILATYVAAGGSPSPGVSAGVSGFAKAPIAESFPPDVARFIAHEAPRSGLDPTVARQNVRKLRTNLGTLHSDVYAFKTPGGSVCFILSGHGGTCPPKPTAGSPGLQWVIGGGYDSFPGRLVGLASDEVQSVRLVVDGSVVSVSLSNNVAFAEFPNAARRATMTIHRADGSESTVEVTLAATPDEAALDAAQHRRFEEARARASKAR